MAKFKLDNGPGQVGAVGDNGDVLGPFVSDAAGIIEVPDDFQEATRALKAAAGVRPYSEPKPKPPKE